MKICFIINKDLRRNLLKWRWGMRLSCDDPHCSNVVHCAAIDNNMVRDTMEALLEASSPLITQTTPGFQQVSWWNTYCKELHHGAKVTWERPQRSLKEGPRGRWKTCQVNQLISCVIRLKNYTRTCNWTRKQPKYCIITLTKQLQNEVCGLSV